MWCNRSCKRNVAARYGDHTKRSQITAEVRAKLHKQQLNEVLQSIAMRHSKPQLYKLMII
jgi:hypothetical protein